METINQLDAIARRVASIRAAIERLRAEESRLEAEFYAGSFRKRDKQTNPSKKVQTLES